MLSEKSPDPHEYSQHMVIDSHDLMQAIVNGTADIIYAKGLDGRYLMINNAGAKLFNLPVENVLGKLDCELPATEASRILLQDFDGQSLSIDSHLAEQEFVVDGTPKSFVATRFCYFSAEGKPSGTIGIVRDVTEMKRLGDALRHSQKMEAIGRLAGGIAHDFNNLLTVIISYSELMLLKLAEDDPKRHQVNEIYSSGQRAAGLTRQLLAFSRKQKLNPQVVKLRENIVSLEDLLRPIVGENIELSIDVEADVADVRMDLVHFEQSLTNLAVNACDAMPHGGKLSIKVENFIMMPQNHGAYPHLKPGRYVQVSVEDTGIGMSETVQARIFEPFFTTKRIGKGTGLGLSMTYGFVTQSGGQIEVSSTIGSGSTFRLYLPCAPLHLLNVESSSSADEIASLNAFRGKETVLLVEDEESVRVLCCRILEACGYSVVQANDGMDALELLQSSAIKVDLLLTDVVMPRLNGPQLFATLRLKMPELPVLFISGFANEIALQDIRKDKHNLLLKPFKPKQLAERVRATLDATAKSGRID